MNRAIIQYQNNSKSIKELGQLFDLIISKFPLLQTQAEDILRAQFVMIVSALDCYIHDVVRIGMLEIYSGGRNPSKNTEKYSINLTTLQQIEKAPDEQTKLAFLEKHIQTKNTEESFQSPKSIEYALGLINIDKIWTKLSSKMNLPPDDIKKQLALVVDRRNKIAHESDRDNLTGSKIIIDKTLIDNTISFIDNLCQAIQNSL
jgi:hypothetical protein